MKINEIGLSWITVSDYQKSKKFFADLGLELNSDSAEYGWAEFKGVAGAALGIAQENPQHGSEKAGTNAVVTFTVDDILATKQEFEAKGVKFLGDIMEVPGHVKLATFVDLDGNKFQIAQILGK
jgi:predicted enzyme related to lactoylglutathione lyase